MSCRAVLAAPLALLACGCLSLTTDLDSLRCAEEPCEPSASEPRSPVALSAHPSAVPSFWLHALEDPSGILTALDVAVAPSGDIVVLAATDGTALVPAATSATPWTLFVMRFSPAGVAIGEPTALGQLPYVPEAHLAIAPNGAVIVSASFDAGGEPDGFDVYVAKLEADLDAVVWERRFGDGRPQYASGLAVTDSGDVIIAGTFEGSFDDSRDPQWKQLEEPALGDNYGHAFLCRLGANDGARIWCTLPFSDQPQAEEMQLGARLPLAVSATGHIYVAGHPSDSATLQRVNEDGARGEALSIRPNEAHTMTALAISDDGRALLGGELDAADAVGTIYLDWLAVEKFADPATPATLAATVSNESGARLADLCLYGASGFVAVGEMLDDRDRQALVWSHAATQSYGDDSAQRFTAVACRDDAVVLVGELDGRLALGDDSVISTGKRDLLIARQPLP